MVSCIVEWSDIFNTKITFSEHQMLWRSTWHAHCLNLFARIIPNSLHTFICECMRVHAVKCNLEFSTDVEWKTAKIFPLQTHWTDIGWRLFISFVSESERFISPVIANVPYAWGVGMGLGCNCRGLFNDFRDHLDRSMCAV